MNAGLNELINLPQSHVHHHTAGLTWGTLGGKVHFPGEVHVPRELLCAGLLCHMYFCIKRQGQIIFFKGIYNQFILKIIKLETTYFL